MRVIRPVSIGDAALVSSEVAETDHPEYASGTTYAAGDKVILSSTHRRYESVAGANIGHSPATSPDKWTDIGPTNRWAMFDDSIGTSTTRTGSVMVEIAPGAIDALALIDTEAESADVTMTVGATVVYEGSRSFMNSGVPINNWFVYFFEPIGRKNVAIFLDLPSYPAAVTKIEINGGGAVADVAVGALIVGNSADLGMTEQGVGLGIIDYSRKETNAFGVTRVVERSWSKSMRLRTLVLTDQVDAVQRLLAGLRARPVLWLGDGGFDSMAVYGFYKDFAVDVAFETVSYCSLTVEGLTST